jgi:(2Fe-2S) ferredoxin
VEPAFAGIARPSVEESLALVARLRPEAVVVVPYLLTAGRLLEKLRTQLSAFTATHPWIRTELADHLGVDSRLVDLVRERTHQALAGQSVLPCDNCQYRTPLAGFAGNVGGLRALLYSVRHTFTHAQATPLEHTHRPIKKHVFVCGNTDCVDRGSIGVLDAFRRCVKDAGRTREIRVTRTSCMGRCGEGPTVAVYPDGIWYRHVAEGDAAEIHRDHLLGDRLVSRLVSDILQ